MLLPDDQWWSGWWNSSWLKPVGYALFASFGGVMGHLMRTIDGKQKINWGRAALEGGAAGFVGLLMLFTCQAMGVSEQWTGVIVGVSGWLGANATIRILESIVMKKLGIQKPSATEAQDDQPAG